MFPVHADWTLPLRNLLTAAPAYDGPRAYYPIDGGRLVAYNLATGNRLWIAKVAVDQEPVAGGEMVFLMQPDAIEALRAGDGGLAWRLPFAATLSVPLAWDNGWLMAGTSDGSILAFRASDGELIWRRSLGSPAHARPALAADRVYVSTEDGRVVSLRIDTGDLVWERHLGGAPSDILALDERLYVGSRDNFFYCLKTADGLVDWRWRTGADVIGMPVVNEHNVFFVSLDNVLRALDRNHGVQQWKTVLPIRPTSGPLKAGEAIIVTGLAPTLRAYSAKDGKALGEIGSTAELGAPAYALDTGSGAGPSVIVVSRDVAKGATITSVARAFEPAIAQIAPLPNPIVLPLTLPAPEPTR